MKNKFFKIFIKIFLIFIVLGLSASLFVAGINVYVKQSVSEKITEDIPDGKYDCVLVLGCGVYPNGTPSPMLNDRLKKGVELYKSGVVSKIIMSGDHGRKNYDEVNIMREYAIKNGVAQEDIFMDHAGFSTYESMYRARDIFKVESMIVVSQKYHLYRALYICEKIGVNAVGASSDYRVYYGQKMRDLREVAARCKDFIQCIFKPEPTFLGESIPVSGDGTVTMD